MCFNIKEDISWQYQKKRLKLEKINVVLIFKISVPGMTECPNCGEYKLSHRVCKTVVLTMVKKSFLNNLYLLKRWNTNSL